MKIHEFMYHAMEAESEYIQVYNLDAAAGSEVLFEGFYDDMPEDLEDLEVCSFNLFWYHQRNMAGICFNVELEI